MSRVNETIDMSHVDDSRNSFMALKKLKQTEEQIQVMRKRFKMLQVKDQEYRAKANLNEQKMKLFQQVKKQKQRAKKSLEKMEAKKQLQTQMWKQKNQRVKEENREKIKEVVETIKSDKRVESKKIREKRIENQRRFETIKKEDVENKKRVRDRIIDDENKQKQKLNQYKRDKNQSYINHKSIDTHDLTSKRANRQQQLQQLMKMQAQMIRKKSMSIHATQTSINKLKQIVGSSRNHKKLLNLPVILNSSKNTSQASTHI